jgi:hypothetical protein
MPQHCTLPSEDRAHASLPPTATSTAPRTFVSSWRVASGSLVASCSNRFQPQQASAPEARRAQPVWSPTAIAVASATTGFVTGKTATHRSSVWGPCDHPESTTIGFMPASVRVRGAPSWSCVFSPQHTIAPAVRRAHVKCSPAASSAASRRPRTSTGRTRSTSVPSPSWPR